jgi:hypothetical protein
VTLAVTTETRKTFPQWDPNESLARVHGNKAVAHANGYSGQVGAKAVILPEQARHGWAGTSNLEEEVQNPQPAMATVFGSTQSASGGPYVSSYQLGCAQGFQDRPMRSWNRHVLNYKCQFDRGPAVNTALAEPKLGEKYNPYLSTARKDFAAPAKQTSGV